MPNLDAFAHAKRGPVLPPTGKTRISIYLDDDLLEAFRQQAATTGKGYQTLINETLRAALDPASQPVTAQQLRQIIRTEFLAKPRSGKRQRAGLAENG